MADRRGVAVPPVPAPDLAALHRRLRAVPGLDELPDTALEPLRTKGMAHAHIRLRGRGRVVRIPLWSQVGLDPAANLAHQAAAFARAAASGHTPVLHAVLPPDPELPMGALVVQEVAGRPPRLPGDLPALARALAALHALPVPPPAARPPLAAPSDPAAATLALIERQAACFERAGLDPTVRRVLAEELARVRRLVADPPAPPAPVALVGTDTHPGNFLIDDAGKAWFLDLEKAQYGLPAIDLAHTTLYTSTTWDPDVATVLTPAEVAGFYRAWSEAVPAALKAQSAWFAPARRLTWLRTLSWMARWKVEGMARFGGAVDPAVLAHVRARIADFFAPDTVARVQAEWREDHAEPFR